MNPVPERAALDDAGLRERITGEGRLWSGLRVVDSTGSTNADVAQAARSGDSEGLVVVAEEQTGGRGRLTRRWVSPPRSAVLVSVLLRPDDVPAHRWTWLPLLTGLAVDETVSACGASGGVKWPNDVLVDGRKLCGILLERVESPAGPAAVIGVGLNVDVTAAERPVETATSLLLEGADVLDRGEVLAMLLERFERRYLRWRAASGDPGELRQEYRSRCLTLGARVRIEVPGGEPVHGTADDVDEHGRLVVDGRAYGAGDVTHVRASTL